MSGYGSWRPLFEKCLVEVGAVNLVMAQRARFEEGLLAVKRRSSWRVASLPVHKGISVALQTQQIDVAHLQHVNIGTAVGRMAGRATLHFHGFMLKHERSLLVGVTTETNGILCRRSADLLGPD